MPISEFRIETQEELERICSVIRLELRRFTTDHRLTQGILVTYTPLIMTGNIIYLIPNSTLSPIAWLMIGALAGFVQFDAKSADVTEARKKPRPSQPGYTRFPEPLPENLTMMEAKI